MTDRGRPARVLVAAPAGSGIIAALRRVSGIEVWRVTDDLPHLLAAAAAGLGSLAILHADLPAVDRTSVAMIRRHGLGVVGVLGVRTDAAGERLGRLGISAQLFDDSPPTEVERVVREALAGPAPPRPPRPEAQSPARALVQPTPAGTAQPQWRQISPLTLAGGGVPRRLIAVWGPTGAPGRSTLATTLAGAFAARGVQTLLVDADPYGGAQTAHFALLDEAPGLVAAVRDADRGELDQDGLESLLVDVGPRLSLLTGLPGPDRWPQLRPAPLEQVLSLCRQAARVVVVDCGFALEDDEELSYDTLAPRRNAATLTALGAADEIVVVGRADRLGVRRLAASLPELRRLVPVTATHLVLNRLRDDDGDRLAAAARVLGGDPPYAVPDDPDTIAQALLVGAPLTRFAPDSPVVAAVGRLVQVLVDHRRRR